MSKLTTFFEQYRASMVAGDVTALARVYAPEFMVSSSDGQQFMRNNRSFRSALKQSAKFYQKAGVAQIKIGKYSHSILDKYHAGVQVEWVLLDEAGQEIIRHDVSYVLFVSREGLRIIFFVSHNEEERWAEKGIQ